MISKNISTPHGECKTAVEVNHLDNGQTVLKVVSELDGHKHEHSVTVGAENGNDRLSILSEKELKDHLQAHLNNVRAAAVAMLSARVKVKKLISELQ